jgi:hypothetical protein
MIARVLGVFLVNIIGEGSIGMRADCVITGAGSAGVYWRIG